MTTNLSPTHCVYEHVEVFLHLAVRYLGARPHPEPEVDAADGREGGLGDVGAALDRHGVEVLVHLGGVATLDRVNAHNRID